MPKQILARFIDIVQISGETLASPFGAQQMLRMFVGAHEIALTMRSAS
jgi:hypothetical protein